MVTSLAQVDERLAPAQLAFNAHAAVGNKQVTVSNYHANSCIYQQLTSS